MEPGLRAALAVAALAAGLKTLVDLLPHDVQAVSGVVLFVAGFIGAAWA